MAETDYVKVPSLIFIDPRIYELAKILEIPPLHAIGCYLNLRFWRLRSKRRRIESEAVIDADAGVPGFSKAVVDVGLAPPVDEVKRDLEGAF